MADAGGEPPAEAKKAGGDACVISLNMMKPFITLLVSDFECVFTTVRVHSLRRMLPSHCLQPITRWHVVRACAKSSRACVSFNSAAGVFVKLVCNFEVRKRAFVRGMGGTSFRSWS
jgi:hypothetical protein